jgi:hypothetical protein
MPIDDSAEEHREQEGMISDSFDKQRLANLELLNLGEEVAIV